MTLPHPAPGFWRNLFFYVMAFALFAVLIWQLAELEPVAKYCPAANLSICFASIDHILAIRDHVDIGLLAVLAFVVIGSMVVTYRLSVNGSGGPDGFHVDIQQDHTTVQTPGGGVVSVPTTTPPPETK